MRRNLILGTVSVLGLATAAQADVPSVAVDIPPVHALASIVMGDLGTPNLLVQPGASPHGYSMRPSEARALDQADAVFWIGEGLEPWLANSIDALASDANVVELMEVEGTTELEIREGATFEAHDHDHDDHGDDDHGDHDHEDHDDHEDAHDEDHDDHADHDHEEHADHDHEKHADHDDHGHDDHEEHAHDDHDDHGDHDHDPHAWLDPMNAKVWLTAIAEELAELDPENADTYRANATAGQAQLDGLITEISAQLDPVRGANFVVFHDAFQYFENRFDIAASGSITLSDASDPSPARIREIQTKVRDLNVACAFSEPQYDANLVDTVFRGTDAEIGVLDPLGADLEPGADLYAQMLRNMATALTDCLK